MRSERGFSLVEVALAIGVVAFALVGIFALVARVERTAREARLEAAAAILSGQLNSLLRASYAWNAAATNDFSPKLRELLGAGRTLADVASGQRVLRTNYFDGALQPVGEDDPGRQFALVVELLPAGSAVLAGEAAHLTALQSALAASRNTVAVHLEVSHPAPAPPEQRSKRRFSTLITRTTH